MRLLEKLWDTIVNNGLGGLLKPWQITRVGLAEAKTARKRMLIQAKTEMDISNLKNGLITLDDKGEVVLDEKFLELIFEDEKRIILKRKINLINTLARAFPLLEDQSVDENLENKSVSNEWFDRWREYAERASVDDFQELWAKILNQEIRRTGSISLRTLDFIRSLSKEEAEKIERICSFSYANTIIYHVADKEGDWSDGSYTILTEAGIRDADLSELNYLGIIEGVEAMGVVIPVSSMSAEKFLIRMQINDSVVIIEGSDKNSKLIFSAYRLTKLGVEIGRILRTKKSMEYFNKIFGRLNNLGFTTTIE